MKYNSKSVRRAIYTLITGIGISLGSMGCSYLKSPLKESEISRKSDEIRNMPTAARFNSDKIYRGTLPIYKEEYTVKEIGENKIINYHSRNMNVEKLQTTLEEQLEGSVDKISSVLKTNQLLIKFNDSPTSGGLENKVTEDQIMSLIRAIDVSIPQIMVNARILKVFADWTETLGNYLEAKSQSNGLGIDAKIELKGATIPGIEELGSTYGIIGEVGSYLLNYKLKQLESKGYVEELASSILVIESGENASVKRMQEFPFSEDTLVGGGCTEIY